MMMILMTHKIKMLCQLHIYSNYLEEYNQIILFHMERSCVCCKEQNDIFVDMWKVEHLYLLMADIPNSLLDIQE